MESTYLLYAATQEPYLLQVRCVLRLSNLLRVYLPV